MYVSNIDENVIDLFSNLEKLDDKSKLKFLIYIFNLINNNQVNNKNETNPNLIENDNLTIFNFLCIGLSDNDCDTFINHLISIYNIMNKDNNVISINGNVEGLVFSIEEKKIISKFEKLSFNDKLDVFREIFIKYDNETFFTNKIITITFDLNGFDIANNILKFKEGV